MNIEIEFEFGEVVFGILHGTFEPEIIRCSIDSVTIDAEGRSYSVTDVATGNEYDLSGGDVTSDPAVALTLCDHQKKLWKQKEAEYLKSCIKHEEESLMRDREKLQALEDNLGKE